MIVGARTHLDLFDLDGLLFLAGFGLALLRLVFELAEVHDLADGRVGVWRNLYQIESGFFGHDHGAFGRNDACILAVCSDQSDFRAANAVVDAWSGVALWWRIMRSAGYGTFP